ncbi:MAG: hypothetical protein LW875_03975 [Proteobacteria bacterium]|nr:hypothetical protein [Pseudomonadota bacterium]
MKNLILSLILISSSFAIAGNGGGTMKAARGADFVDFKSLGTSNDYVFSLGNDGEFEHIVLGSWAEGEWVVRQLELSNSEKINPKFQSAIEASKIKGSWVEVN